MRALASSVALRTGALAVLAAAGALIGAADDAADANIGRGILLLGALVLAVVLGGVVDGVRSVRRGRPDREGVLVWLMSGAAFGLLVAAATGVGIALSGPDPVPVSALLSAALTCATLVAVPAALAFGLARNVVEARVNRRR